MNLVTTADVTAASARIAPHVRRTPLLRVPGERLWIKPENRQPTRSFKVRGAVNAVARLAGRGVGHVVAQSSGNHAQAIAYAAAEHGMRATVVLPDTAPELKVTAARRLGAEVVIAPPALREVTCLALADRFGATVVRSDDFDIIAGHGSAGAEIAADLPDCSSGPGSGGYGPRAPGTILVPVCNGGLLAGIAVAAKAFDPAIRVIGVEPELAADGAASFRAGRRTEWPVQDTYRTRADGLRAPVLGALAWEHIHRYVDDMLTVTEESIEYATGLLTRETGERAEPSGAVATAAYLTHRATLPPGPVVAVLSGGNATTAAPATPARKDALPSEEWRTTSRRIAIEPSHI
ncbi:serine/threonine dehydratase [Microtetraspora sp. NBRC 13810]|uniref:threonine ammonia-lyase n=1 Tax=Microtetraspora sp. NBRC 13810 TaxID=3030990 RepID=UPI0024A034C1|nr:pyridoxal-phosphate dependent enzyme [Microtetraspora sp. NBRC 13810]GLW10445.1 serine/threonine dehydratase [Microtetraspora sp. NBRC 13810]